ncbi:MAG: hypothetical protein KBD66_01750 [Candidatus Doudnabacteria bacterium]|nr:hypothetical protein [Candidatus Doudnabacteria bacterium]
MRHTSELGLEASNQSEQLGAVEVEAQQILVGLKSGLKPAKLPEGPVGERVRQLWEKHLAQQRAVSVDAVTEPLNRVEISLQEPAAEVVLSAEVVAEILNDKQLRALICALLDRTFDQRDDVIADDVRSVMASFPDKASMLSGGMMKVRLFIETLGVQGKADEAAARKQAEYLVKFNMLLDKLYPSEIGSAPQKRTRFEVSW